MGWSIVIGNGFSIDAYQHNTNIYNPNYPWEWDLKNPYDLQQPLLEAFPYLKKHLESIENYQQKNIYEVLQNIVLKSKYNEFYKALEKPDEKDYIHMEACHYLRFAYAWYSNQYDKRKLDTWHWTKWFKRNNIYIDTVLTFNYDTLLESTFNCSNLGVVHASSRQNFIFENGIEMPSEAYVYWFEKHDDVKVVHVAKPHGSSNFTGWVNRETIIDGNIKPLYPIDMILVRDSNEIKVLDDSTIFKPTVTSDLILPGEWSHWNQSSITEMKWVKHQKEIFIEDSAESEKLLIIGFSFSKPDKEEFMSLFKNISSFDEVYIIDPNPSDELIYFLEDKYKCKVYKNILPL